MANSLGGPPLNEAEAAAVSTTGPVLVPLDIEILGKLFTRERVRLLRVLREEGPFPSLGALATRLRRALPHVSTEVRYFEGAGLVACKKKGRCVEVRATNRPIRIG